MSSNITLKRSAISGKIPGTADLGLGELAINTYDGKLFMKKNDGSETIIDITASAGAAYKTGSDDLTTTSINQIVDSFSKVLYRTVKYYVELSTATEYQATELFLTHDGTNVYLTEYATVASGSNLGSITSDISGDSVRLLVTPVSTNTTVKFARIDIDVPFDGSNVGNATAIDNTPIGANIADSGTFTTFSLDSIAETKSVTAVDVFVYDTSKDSDGGAWRKRTQATSWYNEPLNTLTRGSRKEFPAVAVIVAEVSKVTIYDSDDPSLPMWMVFNSNNGTNIARSSVTSISILNGNMTIGHGGSGLTYADFISDAANLISQNRLHNERTIGQRNGGPAWVSTISGGGIVDGTVKDVAMTVLPDAPIDPETGLPIPTIAVATDSGVSVIKDDGTIVDWTPSGDGRVESIYIQDGQIITGNGGGIAYRYSILDQIPQSDTGIASAFEFKQNSVPARSNLDAAGPVLPPLNLGNGVYCMTPKFGALNLLQYNKPDPSKGMVNYTASSYTSGWMPGNIKGAFLADTDTTSLVANQIVTDPGFDTGVGWTISNPANGTWTIANGVARCTSGSVVFLQSPLLQAGKAYVAEFEIKNRIGGTARLYNDGANAYILNATGNGIYTVWFTATSPTLKFVGYATDNFDLDNVYVREADYDRSVNNKGLVVNGTITRTPVDTGSELVGYSGFSASNYLEQPYNSALDFGTGDFSVMGWLKMNNTSADNTIIYMGPVATTAVPANGINFWMFNGIPKFRIAGGAITAETLTEATINQWLFFTATRKNGVVDWYVNGVNRRTTTTTTIAAAIGDPSYVTRIGSGHYTGDNNNLALLRISATAPSAEQVAKIYRDEKVLFQENAACTLYGTSDAVTALSHDPVTDLLHVGTSAGRSVFQGLRRVSNTTVAVGTAISASNGLVVEE